MTPRGVTGCAVAVATALWIAAVTTVAPRAAAPAPARRASAARAAAASAAATSAGARDAKKTHPNIELFQSSEVCLACHNNLTAPSGEDVSIGADWRATMMANSSRDPYWQASVHRETIDHKTAQAEIEDECSICHMPMARTQAHAQGRQGEIFSHLPVSLHSTGDDRLAHDGVSCTVCHQITDQKLGTPDSFTGGYVIDPGAASPRPIYGPFDVDQGHTTIMRTSSGFKPTESAHVRQSELCATCHTLYTTALGPNGEAIGRLPEQMPYLEWRNSSYASTRSCQSCHMPVVDEDMPITSVLGQPRAGLSRHVFRGGNFIILRMLNRYRTELAVEAQPQELDRAVARTVQHLQSDTATLAIESAASSDGRLGVNVIVRNRSGHKFPTAYPSRRAWLHLMVRDAQGAMVFESGAVDDRGAIAGNDNDADPLRVEPHYTQVTRPDQVQIYESVMADSAGQPTTGLLTAVRYLKDNRLLPAGFDKAGAGPDISVIGDAATDSDFTGGEDRVRYSLDTGARQGPFTIEAELRFQPIAFRWAQNLKSYDAAAAQRFVSYYDSMSRASSEVIARATLIAPTR